MKELEDSVSGLVAEQAGIVFVVPDSTSTGSHGAAGGPAATHSFAHVVDRLALYMLPFGLVGGLVASAPVDVVRRWHVGASTVPFIASQLEVEEDVWRLVGELVRPEEVQALSQLWGMKFRPEPNFEFRVYD